MTCKIGQISRNSHLGQKMEMQRMHQSNAALTLRSWWEKPAANDECASGKLFPGQYYDQETGLHYNYFRDYDPSLGRYVQSDPIGMFAGMNLYAYANNNSLKYFDSFGLEADCFLRDIEELGKPTTSEKRGNLIDTVTYRWKLNEFHYGPGPELPDRGKRFGGKPIGIGPTGLTSHNIVTLLIDTYEKLSVTTQAYKYTYDCLDDCGNLYTDVEIVDSNFESPAGTITEKTWFFF